MKKWYFALISVAVFILALGVLNAADYVGAEKCKMCHLTQYKSWSKSKHAKAMESLNAKQKKKKECYKCHVTNNTKDLPGVQCEACHGPGSDYKSMSVMKDAEKAKKAGLIASPGEDVCVECHNDESPEFEGFDYDKYVKKVHEHD